MSLYPVRQPDKHGSKEFLALDSGLLHAHRMHGLLAAALEHTDVKAMAWVRRAHVALEDLLEAFDDGHEEILRRRDLQREAALARDEETDEPRRGTRSARGPAPGPEKELSRDPATIPGAIRLVLSRHPDGLHVGPLLDAVIAERPNTLRDGISAALTPMVRRREIARDGFHKNYRYVLVPPTKPEESTP